MLSEKPRGGLSETRKVTKSSMEKKRRARINSSLTELKTILAGMVTNKGERFEKMEKADILEMTVSCVRQLQRQSQTGDLMSPIPSDEEYKSGIDTCVSEVIQILTSDELGNTDPEIKTKLMDHLANKLCTPLHLSKRQSETPSSMQAQDVLNSTLNCFGKNRLCVSKKPSDDLIIIPQVQHYNPISEVSANESNIVSSPVVTANTQPLYQVTTVPFSNVGPSENTVKPSMGSNQLMTSQSNIPTIPLTILVPANFCSTQLGTTFCSTQLANTCVIPVAWTGASPNHTQQSTNTTSTACAPLSCFVSNTSPHQLLKISPSFSSQFTPIQTCNMSVNVPNFEMDTFGSSVIKENDCKRNDVINGHGMADVQLYKAKPSVIRPTPMFIEGSTRSIIDSNGTHNSSAAENTDQTTVGELREHVHTFQVNRTTNDSNVAIHCNRIQGGQIGNSVDRSIEEDGAHHRDHMYHVDASVWRPW